jgi:hypothetical protein
VGADARRLVAEGKLAGPVLTTRCEPTDPREKVKKVRTYSCIAVTNDTRAHYAGKKYDATIDFGRSRYTFRPAAG